MFSPARSSVTFPESLPVSDKRHEIEVALAEHQVITVCGETGSGKTTQLRNIALNLGRGGWGAVSHSHFLPGSSG